MSEAAPEVAEAETVEAPGDDQQDQEQQKPTETVEFWKQKAREQEKRAKDNAEAAKRLAEIEEANKTEADKAAERLAAAEAEVQQVPAKVTDALRTHLVALHEISDDDADLFLTASDPETLLRQVDRLVARSEPKPRAPRPNAAQTSGDITPQGDWLRQQLART